MKTDPNTQKPVLVGGTYYLVPRHSRVVQVTRQGERLAYVLTPGGDLRAFTSSREVPVPPALVPTLTARYFPD